MFEPGPLPRLFALPPGVDFPRALIAGLDDRLAGQPPEALARVTLIVNTRRMFRRLREVYDSGPARLLPRIRLVTDLDDGLAEGPPAVPRLRRRLELAQLVDRLLTAEPDLAPREALFDLTDSLAGLFEEMSGEGVTADAIAALDVSDQSGHWARAQRFLSIASAFADPGSAPDGEARRRAVVEALCAHWADQPPTDPILLAGSTGSRGTTHRLMQAIARLHQGAVVLPGFDFDLPADVWAGMGREDHAFTAEDHPQYRFFGLMDGLGIGPDDVRRWTDEPPPAPDRNAVLSLALRPAPVTDAWLTEGAHLPDLSRAMTDVTLIEAADPRAQAQAIALRLRQAAEDGQKAALITPDRMLTRQVQAALDRWDIVADDSAGQPLHLAPPGRLLRQIADLAADKVTPDALLALLKHPLSHAGAGRGAHLLHTRDLELWMRRHGGPRPDAAMLDAFAKARRTPPPDAWLGWVGETVLAAHAPGAVPLPDRVAELLSQAGAIVAGSQSTDDTALWAENAGQDAAATLADLGEHAEAGGALTARDFSALLTGLLKAGEVRDRDKPHDLVMIWGTLEARVQGADLLILGGLNEGSWPEAARPDPWLSRPMRRDAGLLLPERRIGLAAHDFQQAAGAPEVWLCRSKRSEDAETVPSRWLNRLTNLLGGLPACHGPEALEEMRARGRIWLDRAAVLDRAERCAPAPRPSPRPPLAARPRKLSVTRIRTLIRDPYAIYAEFILRLRPLNPLIPEADAMLRGTVLHRVFEEFVREVVSDSGKLTTSALMSAADRVLAQDVPWAAERRFWRARVARIADWFVDGERGRQDTAHPAALEVDGEVDMVDPAFVLTAQADRIDRGPSGWILYDYKTGTPPSAAEQKAFDKQLLLEAAMLTMGGFRGLAASSVDRATYIGLSGKGSVVDAPLDMGTSQIWEEFRTLIRAFDDPGQGYTARRLMRMDRQAGDYDQLARFGEWDAATDPTPEDIT